MPYIGFCFTSSTVVKRFLLMSLISAIHKKEAQWSDLITKGEHYLHNGQKLLLGRKWCWRVVMMEESVACPPKI